MPDTNAEAGIPIFEMAVKREVIAVRLVILALGFFALMLFIGLSRRFHDSRYIWNSINLLIVVYVGSPLVGSLLRGVALTITDRGLVDRLGSFNFISWEEIRGAHVDHMMGNDLIALELTNQKAVVDRQPLVRRLLLRYYLRKNAHAFFLKPGFIQGDSEALIQMILTRAKGGANASAV